MTKLFGVSTAAIVLATATAWAQSSDVAPGKAPSTTGARMNSPMDTSSSSAATSGMLTFEMALRPTQVLASDLMDAAVYGNDGNSIGDIKDVVVDSTGQVEAVVIGVGGFLGVGEKTVAVPYRSLNIQRNANVAADRDWNHRNKIVLAATREQLRDAPDFDSSKIAATTGAISPDGQSGPQASEPSWNPPADQPAK